MINGATQIIPGVLGKYLDPLLLAQSQATDAMGYIMIAYEKKSLSDQLHTTRSFDVLFFTGPTVSHCARLNQDLRFLVNIDAIAEQYRLNRYQEETRIYLYSAPPDIVNRFLATLFYEPCLKVQIECLTKKQIAAQLKKTGCQHGIVECNDFRGDIPRIDLLEMDNVDTILQYHPKPMRGRLLLYDIVKNNELVAGRDPNYPTRFTYPVNLPDSTNAVTLPPEPSQSLSEERSEQNTINESDVKEFFDLINQSQNSNLSSNEKDPGVSGPKRISPLPPPPRVTEHKRNIRPSKANKKKNVVESSTSHEISKPNKPKRSVITAHSENLQTLPTALHSNDEIITEGVDQTSQSNTPAPNIIAPQHSQNLEPAAFIHLFERLFRSFRQQLYECFGSKCETIVAEANRKVRIINPEFNLTSLDTSSASSILDLIERIIEDAPFFKRSQLRQTASILIADLYNKHHELLEHFNSIDKVEHCYHRLKRK